MMLDQPLYSQMQDGMSRTRPTKQNSRYINLGQIDLNHLNSIKLALYGSPHFRLGRSKHVDVLNARIYEGYEQAFRYAKRLVVVAKGFEDKGC